jgi:general secretion pathway protein J
MITCRDDSAVRGFSLLEMIIALSVLGMILVMLSQSLRIGLQTWRIEERRFDASSDIAVVDRTLRTLIGRADPGGMSEQPAGFVGTPTSLSFRTTLPAGNGASADREAVVMLLVDPMHRLQLRWLPRYRNWIATPPPPEQVDLLDAIQRIEIRYAGEDGQWHADWSERHLPRLVRIRLFFLRPSGLRWPDIVAAPMRDRWRL